ncbi:MAG: hypothetical protein V1773_09085 [bacterium]
MEISKLYVIQCITLASSNLRLNSDKIASVTLFKEYLTKKENLLEIFQKMKKVTEFSKIAIHLNEILNYSADPKLDFLKLSERFKEHIVLIGRDLSAFLDAVTPVQLKNVLDEFEKNLNLSSSSNSSAGQIKINDEKKETDRLKEEYIFDEEEVVEDYNFEQYQKTVLNPIKELDGFLERLENMETTYDEMDKYYQLMDKNSILSQKAGFEIITNMHSYFAGTLKLIMDSKLAADHLTMEKMRACLIVIAALIREKEVDITSYLNKAESLGKMLQNFK